MKIAQWISDNGLYICFSHIGPFFLEESIRSGVGSTAQINKSPLQDGANTSNTQLEQRTILVKGALFARGNRFLRADTVLDETINILNEAFNPKVFGTLIYNNARGGQMIKGRPVITPVITTEVGVNTVIKFEVEILTDDSYWYDITLNSSVLGTLTKLWTPPTFTLPGEFGIYTQITEVTNTSRMIADTVIEVYSNLEFIKITNETTGKFILVEQAISDNQKMVIDSKDHSVSLYEKDASGQYQFVSDVSEWISTDSEPIRLIPGVNVLRVENEVQNDVPTARLLWRLPIMGV